MVGPPSPWPKSPRIPRRAKDTGNIPYTARNTVPILATTPSRRLLEENMVTHGAGLPNILPYKSHRAWTRPADFCSRRRDRAQSWNGLLPTANRQETFKQSFSRPTGSTPLRETSILPLLRESPPHEGTLKQGELCTASKSSAWLHVIQAKAQLLSQRLWLTKSIM